MHSSFKISNSSESCPVSLGTPSVMRLHSDKRSEELKFYIQSSLTVRKLSARPEDIEDALLVEDTETLALEPHCFNLLATPVTRELLRAEEKSRARDLARQEAAMAVDSAESDTEPTVNMARGEERRRVYGGMKPSKPNVRDPGKSGTGTNRMDQVRADSKQIFRRSQIEKQRASTAGREGNIEAAGAVSLPTNPIPASDLDLPPPLTIRSPPPKNPPVSGLNPLLQGLQPIPQAAPRPGPVSASPTKPGQVPGKPDLVSIQVPMAGADGSQTMQTINIPRSVLAGASDRPILLTVTPKNGINKGQKQIVVLTRNSAGQTSCHVRPPPGAPGAGGRTVISSAESPTKNVQLSPRANAPTQSQPVSNSVIKRHPVVTNSRVVAQPQPKVSQTSAPVQPQQGQKSVVKGQIIQTSRGPVLVQGNRQILLGKNAIQNGKICINQAQIAALTGVQSAQPQAPRVVASGGARPGQTTTRSVITGAQLQNMVASGQRIVSMGTNAGGQQVVRVINSPSQPSTPQRVVQQPAENGQAQAASPQGSTASLSRILSALHNRGLVSQQPNGKFYYVGDKTKSPVGISPGSAVKLATSQGIAISAGNSVPGISRLNPPSVQQQATPVIQQQKSTAAVAVAPATNLDSFMADSDMMMMATSMINSNGTAAVESTPPPPKPSDGETFYYRDRSLPPGWWIKVNKKQVAEYQYQVENFFYSPEGAELKNQENIPAYIAGQLSVDSIGHTPPVSVAQMPWREELSELDKQLVPALDSLVTHQAVAGGIIKRSSPGAGDTGGIDKRFKPDNNVLLA